MNCTGCGTDLTYQVNDKTRGRLNEFDGAFIEHTRERCHEERSSRLTEVFALEEVIQNARTTGEETMLTKCMAAVRDHECLIPEGENEEITWRCDCRANIAIALAELSEGVIRVR